MAATQPSEQEPLSEMLRVYVTPSMLAKIKAQTWPGRNMSDVTREALDRYLSDPPPPKPRGR